MSIVGYVATQNTMKRIRKSNSSYLDDIESIYNDNTFMDYRTIDTSPSISAEASGKLYKLRPALGMLDLSDKYKEEKKKESFLHRIFKFIMEA